MTRGFEALLESEMAQPSTQLRSPCGIYRGGGAIRADSDAKLLSGAGKGWAETCRSVNAAANLPLLQQTKPPGFKAEAEVTPG